MNADDRAPADPQRPIGSGQGAPAMRQPMTGSAPQRTAFRPTTGVQQTTGMRPGQAPAQPQSERPAQSSFAPISGAAPTTGAAPAGAQRPATSFAPTSAPQTTSPRPTTGEQPTNPNRPSGTQPTTTGVEERSATGSVGLGLKKFTDRAKDTLAKGDDSDAAAAAKLGPRKVRVLLSRLDPWSTLKLGFLLSIASGIMFVVAMHILWNVVNEMQTFVLIQEWVSRLFTEDQEVNILQFIDYPRVMSASLLIAVTNVVLISGLSVISAFLYNIVSRVVGGVYLTLTDD